MPKPAEIIEKMKVHYSNLPPEKIMELEKEYLRVVPDDIEKLMTRASDYGEDYGEGIERIKDSIILTRAGRNLFEAAMCNVLLNEGEKALEHLARAIDCLSIVTNLSPIGKLAAKEVKEYEHIRKIIEEEIEETCYQ